LTCGLQISDEDKKIILAAVKEASDWVDSNGQTATGEELDEKLAGS
jgi:heat shock protein 5